MNLPTWEKMCEDYWLWFYSKPGTKDFALDNTAVCTGQNNPDLFFLPGAVARGEEPDHRYKIPAKGKRIFMPILFCSFVDSEKRPKGSNLVEAANKDIYATRSIKCDTSDSITVEDVRRVRVPKPFKVEVANPPFFKEYNPKPGKQMASSDGYWLLTKPLDVGNHKISVNGETAEDNEWHGGVTYRLEVT
jgi:hypothetical protein